MHPSPKQNVVAQVYFGIKGQLRKNGCDDFFDFGRQLLSFGFGKRIRCICGNGAGVFFQVEEACRNRIHPALLMQKQVLPDQAERFRRFIQCTHVKWNADFCEQLSGAVRAARLAAQFPAKQQARCETSCADRQ